MNEQATSTELNGFNLSQLGATVEALKESPGLAHFQFRAKNSWYGGGLNVSSIQDFFGTGQEHTSRSAPFTLQNAEPPVLLGGDEAPNPAEYLLHALAGCVTTTLALHATARGIKVQSINTEVRGSLDLQGFTALDEKVFPGYESIQFVIDVDADCSDRELDELIAFAKAHSPVCSTVEKPVAVQLVRKGA